MWPQECLQNDSIHLTDHQLLGVCWEGMTYVDTVLPFWLRSAPKISAVADMLAWVMVLNGIQFATHYLDDFLILGLHSAAAKQSLTAALWPATNYTSLWPPTRRRDCPRESSSSLRPY